MPGLGLGLERVFVESVSKEGLLSLGIPQVLISMVYLPEAMPASFQAIYTPVESAGTEAQIKHLARLMATQMTAAGLGPGECHVELTWPGVGPLAAGFCLLEEHLFLVVQMTLTGDVRGK